MFSYYKRHLRAHHGKLILIVTSMLFHVPTHACDEHCKECEMLVACCCRFAKEHDFLKRFDLLLVTSHLEHKHHQTNVLTKVLFKENSNLGPGLHQEYLTDCGRCKKEVMALIIGRVGVTIEPKSRKKLIEKVILVCDRWQKGNDEKIQISAQATLTPHRLAKQTFINLTVMSSFLEYREGVYRDIIWPLLVAEGIPIIWHQRLDDDPRYGPMTLDYKAKFNRLYSSSTYKPDTPSRDELQYIMSDRNTYDGNCFVRKKPGITSFWWGADEFLD
jgi:hypothetical protein